MDKDAARHTLIRHALPHIAFDGWSYDALNRGALDAGLSEADVKRLFPDNPAEAFFLFLRMTDHEMITAYATLSPTPEKVRERITVLVRLRLELLAPHREAVRRGMSLAALPTNAPHALTALGATMDMIWRLAGDRATDFNWYSKRLTLAGVYSTTLLYWLGDESPDYQDTCAFLNRRIENVMQFEKTKAVLRSFFKEKFVKKRA